MNKPIIAVTASYDDAGAILRRSYTNAVEKAGGLPVAVPYADEADLARLADWFDGLLLSGGDDVDPEWYGEEPLPELGHVTPERDRLELAVTRLMMERNKPIFAICRGVQVLNVAMGGSLYQDLPSQRKGLQHAQKAPRHHMSHYVEASEGSLLNRIAGSTRFKVNSFHHQAVKGVAPGFRAVAFAGDGVIEAIESETRPFVLGVQWHPEETLAVDEVSRKLFAAFVEACRKY